MDDSLSTTATVVANGSRDPVRWAKPRHTTHPLTASSRMPKGDYEGLTTFGEQGAAFAAWSIASGYALLIGPGGRKGGTRTTSRD